MHCKATGDASRGLSWGVTVRMKRSVLDMNGQVYVDEKSSPWQAA